MTERRTHSFVTLSAIAALAFIVACVSHEVIGHGGACLALGGRITLLSSVYFRCSNGGPLIDASGPLMNFIVGASCYAILRARPRLARNWRLFFAFAMAFNLFWGAGYFILCAITDQGDWAFVLHQLALEPRAVWRCAMGALGFFLYYGSTRLVAAELPSGTPLVVPYLAAGVVACLTPLFFIGGPVLPALREGAFEGFGAVGLLILAWVRRCPTKSVSTLAFVDESLGWWFASALVILGFIATLGRGFVWGGHV